MRLSRYWLVVLGWLAVVPMVGAGEPVIEMGEIQRVIRESEYHVSWQDETVLPGLNGAWHATNRAQNLRFYFTEDGLRVVDRREEESPVLLRLAASISPDQSSRPGTFDTDGREIVIVHDGLTERFLNAGAGLEHTLVIDRPGVGDRPVDVEIRWSAAGLELGAGSATFVAADRRRLNYSLGEAFDALGAPVEIALLLRDGCLTLSSAQPVDAYPLTIKNLLTGSTDTILEGNLAGLRLAARDVGDLNGDGFDDVVASATGWDGGQVNEGAVLVFLGEPGGIAGNGSGSIAVSADAIIESNVAGSYWPSSADVVGDVNGDGYEDLLIGDLNWDPVNPPASTQYFGAVWLFEGSGLGITATSPADADARIVSDVGQAAFGSSVDAAGDVNGDGYADVIVGASVWEDDPTQLDEGAAFVFHGSAGGLTATTIAQAEAVIEGNAPSDEAGTTVAGLGDVNGDGFDDVGVAVPFMSHGEAYEGGIAIFHGGTSGIASNPTTAPADAADALIESNITNEILGQFAAAGDVNGDGYCDLIVGLPGWEDSAAHSSEGAVAVFHGGSSGIQPNGTNGLLDVADTVIEGNPSPHQGMALGSSVQGIGDVNGDGYGDVAAGAWYYTNPELREGALFVFHGGAGGIPDSGTEPVVDVADVFIEGNMADLYLGAATSGGDVNGDGYSDLVLPVGQYTSSEVNEGAIFIYHGGADDLDEEPIDHFDGNVAFDWFSLNTAGAGDLNGDGFADIVIGLPLYDFGSTGRVHVFLGSSAPSLASPHWTYDGHGQTGQGVGSAGDVNGDGYGDLVVGRWIFANPETNEGRVEIFYGSDTGLPAGPDWSFESDIAEAKLGYSVASAGDINGDGYADLVVGAPYYTNGELNEGRAYVFFGSAQGLPSQPGWTFENNVADSLLGVSVASAGDVNGDGFGDVIIGAPDFESGHTEEGAAYGFWGSAAGLPDTPNWIIETDRTNTDFGRPLTGVGDVNGDGFDDVVVGAPFDSNGETGEGRAYVYHGSPGGLSTAANRVLERNIATAGFGFSVSGAGDVNGDGFADLVVGSPTADGVGRAYLYTGSASGVGANPAWSVEGAVATDWLGGSVAGVGDFDGDGFSDVVVGVPFSDVGGTDGGSVKLFLGNAGVGRPVMTRQLRGGGDPTPVQPWGLSHSGDDYQVSITATSPWGRELAKLHVEACPTGKTWGDVECRHQVSASWTPIPLGENGVTLTETLSGLTGGTLYHWRAHVLYLPLNADQSGITEPPVPRHGPWRTLSARASVVDIRAGEPHTITIEMVSTTSSVGEGAIQAEVEIVMTTSDGAVSQIDCSVDSESFDQTAVATEDYVAVSSNLLFPSGTTSGTIQVVAIDLIDDALDESDEDFGVELSNPVGGVLGSQTAQVVTILDDDPPPELSAVDVQVDEGAGNVTVILELSAPTSFEVVVNYSTADGSALAPTDYGSASGIATIAPLDTTVMVDIPIVADGLDEIDESFTVELTGASNATLMSPTVAVTILDDDPPPELSAVDIQADEHDGVAVVTLELSGPTSFEVTADYSTTDGSATAPADYEPVSGTATIPPLATQTTVEIPIVNDWLEESPESFFLELTGPVDATLLTPSVEVTILDNDAGIIFADGFESGGTTEWSTATQ